MTKKIFLTSVAVLILLINYGCRPELFNDDSEINLRKTNSVNIYERYVSSFVSQKSLDLELKKDFTKISISKAISKVNSTERNLLDDTAIYESVYDNEKNITTYTLNLIEYSNKNKYILKHIITKKNEEERSGFLKIIPSSKTYQNNDGLENFTGVVQILDMDMVVISQSTYENGVKQTNNNQPSSSRVDCWNEVDLIVHTCSHGGNHEPGEICKPPHVNDAYYEIEITVKCGWVNEPVDDHIAGGTIGGGGGGPTLASRLLNHRLFLYEDFILEPNKKDLLNFVMGYLYSNGYLYGMTISDNTVTELNQKIEIFYNNPQLFTNFDALNTLWTNSNFFLVSNKYYDLRIYNLIDFLFDNPTQPNADFVNWATLFFTQNTSQNGICNIGWSQFQNWFVDGTALTPLEMQDFLSDLNNPDRVKPTRRFKNHVKINGIYNQIKSAANFKQYLQNFEPTFSVAHLMFDLGATSSNAYAHTTPPENYWIKIVFNQNIDWANTPKIVIADTFMHEMIHAEIFRKLLSLASTNGSIDTTLITQYLNEHNYPGLFDYYVKRTVGNDNWQHEAMAAHYVNIMVNFLKQVYGTTYTITEYKTVVWMGLKGTIAWNLLPLSERTLYENTWNSNYWLWEL